MVEKLLVLVKYSLRVGVNEITLKTIDRQIFMADNFFIYMRDYRTVSLDFITYIL